MKYIPSIPKRLNNNDLQNIDDSPLKNDEYKGETNYINYKYVMPILAEETEDMITEYIPNPTQQDYTNGYFIRYFLKKRNEMKLWEVSMEVYNGAGIKYDELLYDKFQINWKLTGSINDKISYGVIVEYGIKDTNRRTIQMANKKYNVALDKIVRNYLEFAKYTK